MVDKGECMKQQKLNNLLFQIQAYDPSHKEFADHVGGILEHEDLEEKELNDFLAFLKEKTKIKGNMLVQTYWLSVLKATEAHKEIYYK